MMDNAHVVEQQIRTGTLEHTHASIHSVKLYVLHHNTQKTPEAAEVGKGARSSIVKE